jgi:hypothetical protein
VNGSLCAEDLKWAVSAAGHGDRPRERERESYCEVRWLPDVR